MMHDGQFPEGGHGLSGVRDIRNTLVTPHRHRNSPLDPLVY